MIALNTLVPFGCPRTCPLAGERWCRFRAVLDALGPVRVDSHTAKVKVDYTDPDAFRAAVLAMGGRWIGQGTHELYETKELGLGFALPGWEYPLCLKADGEIAFDDFKGAWGNVADLDRIRGEYAMAKAELAANRQGWQSERINGALVIYHPTGGTLTVDGLALATAGFTGGHCHEAAAALGLQLTDVNGTAEGNAVAAGISLRS